MDISKLRKKAKEQSEKFAKLKEKQIKEPGIMPSQDQGEKNRIKEPLIESQPEQDRKPVSTESDTLLELAHNELKKYTSIDSEKELLCFNLGEEEYGMELSLVKEIIRVRDITPVPNTAKFVLGIVVLRGGIMPLIDMRTRIGLPFLNFSTDTRFVMVDMDNAAVGLVVDKITNVKRISSDSIKLTNVSGSVDVKFLSGISTYNGGFTVVLNLKEIIKSSDMLKA